MSKPLIILTGASSGIGAATAKLLSENGYPLLLLARRIDKLKALKLENTLCKAVDVTDIDSFKAAINEAENSYGPADCLINNAGIMLLGAAETQAPAQWQTMLNVNVMGVMNGIHCVLQKMIDANHGTIINVSSIAGRKTFPNHAVYCASKFGVHALSENIRGEVADKDVRVITIAPGAVETELLGHTQDETIIENYQQWKDTMGPVLNPIDIANAIFYAYQQPQNVCVRELVIAPTRQDM